MRNSKNETIIYSGRKEANMPSFLAFTVGGYIFLLGTLNSTST
jgi:hypothetical protein